MSDLADNPYAAPQAAVADRPLSGAADRERLVRIASGQRLMVIAVLVGLGALLLLPASPGRLVTIGAWFAALFGTQRVATGLGRSAASRFILAVGMLLPLLNVLVVVHLSARATKALREAGVRVGLLGARPGPDLA